MSDRIPYILLVEDDPDDADFMRQALEDSGVPHELETKVDGQEALSFLLQEVPYQAARSPDLVLLDLNLPKKSGREILRAMSGHPLTASISVVVLTNFMSDLDDLLEEGLKPFAELSKPPEQTAVKRVLTQWLEQQS